MNQEKDYYWTATYPDGAKSGPTRMLCVHTEKEANKVIRRLKRQYPDCEFTLTWSYSEY